MRKFGNYLILDCIAEGGMAEIFRAWEPSIYEGGRFLALKCVRAEPGMDDDFLQMFRSEIRIMMGLNHPNIVQLHDFGEFEGRPFIAMELVEGKPLKNFIRQVFKRERMMPPEYAVYLIQQAAAGLHFAHSYRDNITGTPLNIVHRDISPQNLLISYDGNLKIIDFGVAKAASNRHKTQTGVIKGKLSYLSPEQLRCQPLDGRSDLFSLGIVLWETLTGKKLFDAEAELAALRMIEECDWSVSVPSSINPAVPPALDAIVMKALREDREQRFANADAMQRELYHFLYSYRPDFNPRELTAFMGEIFKAEIEKERQAMLEFGAQIQQASNPKTISLEPMTPKEGTRAAPAEISARIPIEPVPIDLERRKAKRNLSDFFYTKRPQNPAPPTNEVSRVYFKLASFATISVLAVLAVFHWAPHPASERLKLQSRLSSLLRENTSEKGPVTVSITPQGGPAQIFLNQQLIRPDAQGAFHAAVGVKANLKIIEPGFQPFEAQIQPISAQTPLRVIAALEPRPYGKLSLQSSRPALARITQGSLVWELNTPIQQLKLPPGKYQVELTTQDSLAKTTLELTIVAGWEIDRKVNMNR